MKKPKIILIHWNALEAAECVRILRNAGFNAALKNSFGPQSLKEIEKYSAVVIDLSRMPSHGRDVAMSLRTRKTTRHIPIVFVDGDPEKVARVRTGLPDAVYTTWERAESVIRKAIATPVLNPIVPASNLAGYSGTPLPKKLGIKQDSAVLLMNAPSNFVETLKDLPEGVLFKSGARGSHDLILWFVGNLNELRKNLQKMVKLCREIPMWIIWPKKGSLLESDLTERHVRETGLGAGLVDYKICAVDETWSGLLFRKRRT